MASDGRVERIADSHFLTFISHGFAGRYVNTVDVLAAGGSAGSFD